jgi:spore maturation protein CgeB
MTRVVFLKNKIKGAWEPIIKGYQSAFAHFNFKVEEVENFKNLDGNYFLFLREWEIEEGHLSTISQSKKTFLFVQPTQYDLPWGNHPNFISNLKEPLRKEMASYKNVYKWTFADLKDENFKNYYSDWGFVNTLPLAFDNLNYKKILDEKFRYDVCFIGGWANNGFNEKKKILIDTFSAFVKSDLKCGFFINKAISHNIENKILANSKVCLNIHDKYQRVHGRDTNERTFKSLGLNGIMVSDQIEQQNCLFPNLKNSNEPQKILKYVKEYVNMSESERQDIANDNRKLVLAGHTYIHRVGKMLDE